jgi:glucan endo-1,3-alpha-glucosidase
MYNDKAFVSSFWGQGTDWASVKSSVGKDLYVVPYYCASEAAADDTGVDGLFSW